MPKITGKPTENKIDIPTADIIAMLPGNIYWLDKNGVFLGCNNNMLRMIGLKSIDEYIGKTYEDLYEKSHIQIIKNTDQKVMSQNRPIVLEETAIAENKKPTTYLTRKEPLHDALGNVVGLLGVSIDITAHKRTKKQLLATKHKLEAITAVSFSMAHELRTPLATLEIATSSLNKFLPTFITAYKVAKEVDTTIPEIHRSKLEALEHTLKDMKVEIQAASNFIDMLLMKIKPSVSAKSDEVFSIRQCIQEALSYYPFHENQRALIDVELSHNFSINGDPLLLRHVFFNLLKNALYYIDAAGKGRINIWLEIDARYNKVYFEDTGKGIPADALPKIFRRFFSQTYHGAGVGLTFCKMVMTSLGGKITCKSVEGEYTRFTLFFPRNKSGTTNKESTG